MKKQMALGALVFFGCIGISNADMLQIAPFYGYRFGGTLANELTGNSVQVDAAPSEGATVSLALPSGKEHLEFLYSNQDSDLSGLIQSQRIDVRTEVWQLGVNRDFPGSNEQVMPFLAGYLGITNINFSGNLGADSLFSFGMGGGVKYFPTEHIGFRLDIRGFVSFVEGGGGIACSGGCVAHFEGSGFFQGEITPSVVVQF